MSPVVPAHDPPSVARIIAGMRDARIGRVQVLQQSGEVRFRKAVLENHRAEKRMQESAVRYDADAVGRMRLKEAERLCGAAGEFGESFLVGMPVVLVCRIDDLVIERAYVGVILMFPEHRRRLEPFDEYVLRFDVKAGSLRYHGGRIERARKRACKERVDADLRDTLRDRLGLIAPLIREHGVPAPMDTVDIAVGLSVPDKIDVFLHC